MQRNFSTSRFNRPWQAGIQCRRFRFRRLHRPHEPLSRAPDRRRPGAVDVDENGSKTGIRKCKLQYPPHREAKEASNRTGTSECVYVVAGAAGFDAGSTW